MRRVVDRIVERLVVDGQLRLEAFDHLEPRELAVAIDVHSAEPAVRVRPDVGHRQYRVDGCARERAGAVARGEPLARSLEAVEVM